MHAEAESTRIIVRSLETIHIKASMLLSEYLGNDLSKIANELEKLLLNVTAGQEITLKHIHDNIGISKEYNVFELQAALGKKDVLKANQIVNYFEANPKANPLVLVLGNLNNFFSKVPDVRRLYLRISYAGSL